MLTFESGIERAGGPVTHANCLAATLERHQPGVLLLDRLLLERLDPSSLRRIQRCPDVRVLVVADQATQGVMVDVLRNRFRGLLLTTSPPDLCVKAIRAVSNGELWLSRRFMAKLITDSTWAAAAAETGAAAKAESTHALESLSRRERQVVAQLQRGFSNKEIARRLGIVEDTVKKHLKSIFAKLGVHRRALVVLQASATALSSRTRGHHAGDADLHILPAPALPGAGPAPFRHSPAAGTRDIGASAAPRPRLHALARA